MDGVHEVVQRREVFIVGCQSAQQFPDALDGIEFRAVRREEVEPIRRGARVIGVMVGGVVEDEDRGSTATPMPGKQSKEGLKRACVEDWTEHGDELVGVEVDGSKERREFARGRVQHRNLPSRVLRSPAARPPMMRRSPLLSERVFI